LGIPVADPGSRLAVLLEFPFGRQQGRERRSPHRRDRPLERRGQRGPIELRQLRFWIEEVDVARATVHEQPNHGLRLAGEMSGSNGVHCQGVALKERVQREQAEATAGASKEFAAGGGAFVMWRSHCSMYLSTGLSQGQQRAISHIKWEASFLPCQPSDLARL